jgi:hypothetical protein
MKMLLMAMLFVASLAPPGAAQVALQKLTPQDIAERTAVLLNYDAQCGGLPPKTKEFIGVVTKMADDPLVDAAMLNVWHHMYKIGKSAWCAEVHPWVIQIEDADK